MPMPLLIYNTINHDHNPIKMLDYNELSYGDVGWDEKLSVDAAGGSEHGPIETIWTQIINIFSIHFKGIQA